MKSKEVTQLNSTLSLQGLVALAVLTVFHGGLLKGDDWPGFRGPSGDGSTQTADFPVRWSQNEGILWAVEMSQPGNGSPIVVGDRVFVTSAEDEAGKQRSLICLSANDGEELWRQTVSHPREMPTHKTNPYAGSTPASDGKIVVVWHGSAGLHAYTVDGIPIWQQELGDFQHMWGYGTSPIIIEDKVVLHTGPGKRVFVMGFDLKSGEEIWRHEEPVEGNGERNSDGQYMGSWSTPVIHRSEQRTVAVCPLSTRVCAFDVDTGELHWFCNGLRGERGDLAYSSAMIRDDICVVMGGFKGPGFAFRIKGHGDISSETIWSIKQNPQMIGTGLILEDSVFRVGAGPGVIDCLDLLSGEVLWQQRAGTYWSSLVFDGRRAMAIDQKGAMIVFEPKREGFVQVAENQLRDRCNATPALAHGRIYIRTMGKLWCVGN